MSESWTVFLKTENSWRAFAYTDDFFDASWIRDRLIDTGFIPGSHVDISKGNGNGNAAVKQEVKQ